MGLSCWTGRPNADRFFFTGMNLLTRNSFLFSWIKRKNPVAKVITNMETPWQRLGAKWDESSSISEAIDHQLGIRFFLVFSSSLRRFLVVVVSLVFNSPSSTGSSENTTNKKTLMGIDGHFLHFFLLVYTHPYMAKGGVVGSHKSHHLLHPNSQGLLKKRSDA